MGACVLLWTLGCDRANAEKFLTQSLVQIVDADRAIVGDRDSELLDRVRADETVGADSLGSERFECE
eukprot:1417015-Rhodomonas_salina.1